jgi:hypothetical protein
MVRKVQALLFEEVKVVHIQWINSPDSKHYKWDHVIHLVSMNVTASCSSSLPCYESVNAVLMRAKPMGPLDLQSTASKLLVNWIYFLCKVPSLMYFNRLRNWTNTSIFLYNVYMHCLIFHIQIYVFMYMRSHSVHVISPECDSDFHQHDEMPNLNNLKKRNLSWLKVSEVSVHCWLLSSWSMMRQIIMEGKSMWWKILTSWQTGNRKSKCLHYFVSMRQ